MCKESFLNWATWLTLGDDERAMEVAHYRIEKLTKLYYALKQIEGMK